MTADETRPPEPALPPAGWRIRGTLADKVEVLAPLVAYVVAVVSGFSTSSLGLLRQSLTGDIGGQLGDSLPIRSDEWLTAAPIELATLANGSSMRPPLSQGPDLIYQVSSGSFFETIFFAEGNFLRLGPLLPDTMLFAAFRGFPWLLLFLTLPPLLRRLGANRPMSWLGTSLVFLAPASIWWSFMPIRILGFAAAGSFLLVLARDRIARHDLVRGVLLALLAGGLCARLVTFYVPWSLTVGIPLVLATAAFLVWDRDQRRAASIAIGAGAAFGVFILVAVFWENAAALSAELNTVYPGQRRSTGTAMAPHFLLGAPGLSELEDDPVPNGTNQSEVSSAFLVCGLVAALLWGTVRRRFSTPQRAAYLVLAGFTALWVSWCAVSWGGLGKAIPGLNVMLPERAAQTVGFPATLLMVLALSALARGREEPSDARRALVVSLVATAATAYAVSSLTVVLPNLSTLEVWAYTLLTGAAVYAVVRFPRHWVPVVAVSLAALLAAVDANPIVFGLGEVRTSDAAQKARAMRTQAEDGDFRWAADSMATDALMVANGVPLINGYQVTGPDRDGWDVVDPTGQYEGIWNRGASYLLMSFDGKRGADPVVIEENNDVIRVQTDPCWLVKSPFEVRRIVAQGAFNSRCADEVGSFEWNGQTQRVYELHRNEGSGD